MENDNKPKKTDHEQRMPQSSEGPAAPADTSGSRPATDEIADKGEPRPFEEGWKDQEKYRAD